MSGKDCGHHKDKKKERLRRIFAGTLIFLFIVLLIILIIWAVLRPTKPRFVLLDATVFAFNVSAPNLLTSTFQVTVRSTNPNDHIGVYYDRLLIYASFSDQQITLPTSIPPTYQDTNGVSIWSPFVTGVSVPIAPFIGETLKQDQTAGNLPIRFKMDGRVRWKVGAITTGTYRIHVNCLAYIAIGNPSAGIVVSNNVVKYQLYQGCSVSV
ncbi:hypothetical protein V2J09_012190 [Rumex salicifolius]